MSVRQFFDLKYKKKCQRHGILLTPHKCESTQCGVMQTNAWYACRKHATMTPRVAYLRHAEFHTVHLYPKLRYRLLGVNRITCFQHASINSDFNNSTFQQIHYPALRAPVGGFASFSSSLGRALASMALHSLVRRILKKGNLNSP